MLFKRFTFLIIVRTVFLMINVIVISLIFGDKRLFFNQIILSLILVAQVFELIRFVNRTNRELAKLFDAIRHSDFSITFKPSFLGRSFRELDSSMMAIIESYKQVKIEKEAQFHFLQLLVNQVNIGIVAVDQQGQITLINPTAEKMLGVPLIKNWKLLQSKNPSLTEELESIGPDGKKLIQLKTSSESYFVSVNVRTLIMLDMPLKLITLQNIDSEIEQKEIEAWHKLIRILTHEIMNSVTPIASLTETMQGMLVNREGELKTTSELRQETISDIRFSLDTIHRRTDGLLHFVENYRQLMRVPKPTRETIDINAFFHRITQLMTDELSKRQIGFHCTSEKGLVLIGDPMLLEQVLINLITNSMHAVDGRQNPQIQLSGYTRDGDTIIEVKDNGKGIPKKELTEIFVPFFTTKKDGSGIGLSLSKQIMSLHGGSIRVRSEENVATSFFLIFNTHDKATAS